MTLHGRSLIARHELPLVTAGMDHAVRAIGKLYQWSGRLSRPLPPSASALGPATERPVGEKATLDWLSERGIPTIPQRVSTSREEVVEAAAQLRAPVALKILSPDIQHKTEVGGVLLDLDGAEAVGEVASATGVSRRDVYQRALALVKEDDDGAPR